jgi:hypothetical protein
MLYKRGHLNRAWKRRLFILTAGHLCYFTADEGAKHLRGKVALAQATVALAANESAPHAFQLMTPSVAPPAQCTKTDRGNETEKKRGRE